ncbi:MAG: hypothetical protein WCH98_23730, partial [Verrucomicrobiota bacterium]
RLTLLRRARGFAATSFAFSLIGHAPARSALPMVLCLSEAAAFVFFLLGMRQAALLLMRILGEGGRSSHQTLTLVPKHFPL